MSSKKKDTRPYVNRRLVFKGRRVTVYRDHVVVAGQKRIRDWSQHPRVSAVVVEKSRDEIVLVRQYRHGVNCHLWEIPAGTVDAGESPFICARRECEEETGFYPKKIKALGSFMTAPAGSDERVFVYLAKDLKETQMNPDPDEELQVKCFKKSKVKQMLRDGKIRDAKSIIGLYRYFYK